ncbi:MAG: hypothetical protein F2693_05900 [Actinobacteria bacterium]|nr:hypothetical protein [Actinomycetota bacterium]
MKWVVGAAAAVGLVAGVLAGIVWGWSWAGRDRDELAGWVEAGATAAAFVAAAVAAVFAAGAFRLESRREQRWEEQQRSAQAALIAAWFEMRPEEWSHDGDRNLAWMFPSSGTDHIPSVAYRNASDVPVTRVRVELLMAAVDAETGGESGHQFGVMTRELIPPSSERGHWDLDESMVDKREELVGEATNAGYDQTLTRVVLEFTDAAGRRWVRDADGRLTLTFEPRDPRPPRWWRVIERRRRRREAERWDELVSTPPAQAAS